MNKTTSIIKTSAQVLVILMIMTCCRVNNKIDTYEQLIDSVNSLEEKELFHEAGELLLSNQKLSATNSFSFKKELIYVNEKTENYTANLDIFREGHQEGKFFMINPRIPKFKPYLNLPDFNEIAQRDMFLRDSTNKVSTAQTQVLMPQNIRDGRVYPTVFIFHGGGSNIDRARKNWTSE